MERLFFSTILENNAGQAFFLMLFIDFPLVKKGIPHGTAILCYFDGNEFVILHNFNRLFAFYHICFALILQCHQMKFYIESENASILCIFLMNFWNWFYDIYHITMKKHRHFIQ